MASITKKTRHDLGIPSLPARVVSTLGETVKLEGPLWRLRSNKDGLSEATVSIRLLDNPKKRGLENNPNAPTRASMYHQDFIYAIKVFIAELIPRISPRGVDSNSRIFHHFERYIFDNLSQLMKARSFHFEDLTYEIIFAYVKYCIQNMASKGSYGRIIRKFYQWGVLKKITGFDKVVYRELCNIRMPGSLKGHITRFRDPQKGAFTWEEQVQIHEKIINEEGDDEGRAIVSIYQQLGIRPEALILLRCKHLEVINTRSGQKFFLYIPRVKKPRAIVALDDYVRKPINSRLGNLILGFHPAIAEAPDSRLLPSLNKSRPYQEIRRKMLHWADEVNLVTTRLSMEKQGWRNRRLKRNWSQKFARLPLTAYRFRRTLATNLAEQGATVYEIAEALDDQSIHQALIYIENTSIITDILESTLDSHPDWAQIINLFRGEVLEHLEDALPEVLGGAPHLTDYGEFCDIGSIGRCAKNGSCELEPPLSCYTCPFFRPTLNIKPHMRQLVQIQREINKSSGVESDRMSSILRKNMAAIVQVLSRLAPNKGALSKVFDRIKATRIR